MRANREAYTVALVTRARRLVMVQARARSNRCSGISDLEALVSRHVLQHDRPAPGSLYKDLGRYGLQVEITN